MSKKLTVVLLSCIFQFAVAQTSYAQSNPRQTADLETRQQNIVLIRLNHQNYVSVRENYFYSPLGVSNQATLFAQQSAQWFNDWSQFKALLDELKATGSPASRVKLSNLLRSQSNMSSKLTSSATSLVSRADEGIGLLAQADQLPDSPRFAAELSNLKASRAVLLEGLNSVRRSALTKIELLKSIDEKASRAIEALAKNAVLNGAGDDLKNALNQFAAFVAADTRAEPLVAHLEIETGQFLNLTSNLWIFKADSQLQGIKSKCELALSEIEKIDDLGEQKNSYVLRVNSACQSAQASFDSLSRGYTKNQVLSNAQLIRTRKNSPQCRSTPLSDTCKAFAWLSALSKEAIEKMNEAQLKVLEDSWIQVEKGGVPQ